MRLLSSAVSPTRPPRALRPRGPAGHARATATGPGRPAASAGAGPDAEEEGRRTPRLDALLERALARMAHTLAEGGEARAAAASHAGPEQGEDEARDDASAASDKPAAGLATAALLAGGLGWTYAADAGDGIRASAWSDRLARARARAGAPGAPPDAGARAAGTGPFRLSARQAAVVIGPDFGEEVFEVAPGQSLVFAFSAPPAAGLAAVEIAAEEDAMRLALAGGPVLRLRGLELSGRVALNVNGEEIELAPGAPTAAVDARI